MHARPSMSSQYIWQQQMASKAACRERFLLYFLLYFYISSSRKWLAGRFLGLQRSQIPTLIVTLTTEKKEKREREVTPERAGLSDDIRTAHQEKKYIVPRFGSSSSSFSFFFFFFSFSFFSSSSSSSPFFQRHGKRSKRGGGGG